MDLARNVKTALDETRLLILGAQVLFGFQLSIVFQEAFGELSATTRLLTCAGQALMAVSIGLLIAPSMQHRIVEGGEDSFRIQRATSLFAGLALLPFAVGLALGVYLIFDRVFGPQAGLIAGALCGAVAVLSWYGLEFVLRERIKAKPRATRCRTRNVPPHCRRRSSRCSRRRASFCRARRRCSGSSSP